MSGDPANQPEILTPPSGAPAAGVPGLSIYETGPDSITQHRIWDHELDSMTNISRPIVLGLATMFIGAAIGLIPTIKIAFDQPGSLNRGDLVVILLAGGCVAAGLAFGYFAVQGQLDARKLKREIRARSPRQLGAATSGAVGISP